MTLPGVRRYGAQVFHVFRTLATYAAAAADKVRRGSMRRLFWIGSPFFWQSLRETGWDEVAFCNFEEPRVLGWQDVVRQAGFVPDVVVVADKSRPPFVLGVEDFPCFTVFYSVDSHIHGWQPWYAQAFDACLVSLRDHLPRFAGDFLPPERIWWSPAFAWAEDRPDESAERCWDALFVGTVSDNTPLRAAFLRALGETVPGLHVTRGAYRRLYPQAQVVLNQCEHGDLNFRVFEALGCGSCLLTPRIGHGLTDLFAEDEELVCYTPHDADDAAARLRELLAAPEHMAELRRAGLAAVDARHRAIHRARAFSERLRAFSAEEWRGLVESRRRRAAAIRQQVLRLPCLLWAEDLASSPDPAVRALRAAYLAEARTGYTGQSVV